MTITIIKQTMKRLLTLLTLIVTLTLPALAHGDAPADNNGDNAAAKREQWFKEMRAKKHEFLARELELTPEQREPFFAVYDRMEDSLKAINDETRRLEKSLEKKKDPTDADYDAVIEAIYNQRYREWTVENQAREEFAKILTKKQMVRLKKAESRFTRALMKQHREHKK